MSKTLKPFKSFTEIEKSEGSEIASIIAIERHKFYLANRTRFEGTNADGIPSTDPVVLPSVRFISLAREQRKRQSEALELATNKQARIDVMARNYAANGTTGIDVSDSDGMLFAIAECLEFHNRQK